MRQTLFKLNYEVFVRQILGGNIFAQKTNNIWTPSHHFTQFRQISLYPGVLAKLTSIEEVTGEPDVNKNVLRDPSKDRTKVIPYETSIKYMESNAYAETYGELPVWVPYRRNFKGHYLPRLTRKKCVVKGQIKTGSPCPICRDEYLVLDYRHPKLLQQFISPHSGEILHWDKTGLCQHKQLQLRVEIEKARDYGTFSFDVPIREYNYEEYYGTTKFD